LLFARGVVAVHEPVVETVNGRVDAVGRGPELNVST
jgi:hypothetical protein